MILQMNSYHDPVLLKECIEALAIKENGIYVDATFGGGGHSRMILQKLGAKGHLLGFDQDEDALSNVSENENERFTFVHHNFRYLKRFLRLYGYNEVDGILADLGVSSHQLDDADRGFSFRYDTDLDMRMNQQGDQTAADILNDYDADDLQRVFSQYGELRNSKTLAQRIVSERVNKPLKKIGDFLLMIDPLIRGARNRYLAQVFQAIRIEVNDAAQSIATAVDQQTSTTHSVTSTISQIADSAQSESATSMTETRPLKKSLTGMNRITTTRST